MSSQVATLQTRLEGGYPARDAVIVQEAQAEQFAVSGGQLGFEVADRSAPGVTFLAELDHEDVRHMVAIFGRGGGFPGGAGGLLGA